MTTIADKPMDLAEASQRIVWLDDERRRDHAELARLAQELTSTLAVLKDQTVKLRETSDRLDAVEASLTRLPRLEDAITLARAELAPLREIDIQIQDKIQRQAKDRQAHSDQTARALGDIMTRLDTLAKSIDGLGNRLHTLETQRNELANRVNEIPGRLEIINKAADGLAARLHLVEAQYKGLAQRMNEITVQLDALGKAADGLSARSQLLEAQQKGLIQRLNEIPVRLDALGKTADALTAHLQSLATQHKALAGRADEMFVRLDNLAKASDGLATRIQLQETREQERLNREAMVQAQIVRMETAQGQAFEEVKRVMARAESLIPEIQQIRREIVVAQEEGEKRRKDDVANLIEQKEALAALQRQVEEIMAGDEAMKPVLERLRENTFLIADAAHRLSMLEEQLAAVQAAYKGYQEVQDARWGIEVPELRNMIEEAHSISHTTATTAEELLASNQALKEDIRALSAGLVEARAYSEDLTAALRGLLEEDVQARMTMAQKQLANLRRLANTPVDNTANE